MAIVQKFIQVLNGALELSSSCFRFCCLVVWRSIRCCLSRTSLMYRQACLLILIHRLKAVSAFLAAMSFTSSNAGSGPDEYRENETSDDGYIITADDLEMIIRDALSLGRSENGDEE